MGLDNAPMSLRPLPDKALVALKINPTDVSYPGTSPLETPVGTVWVKTIEPPKHIYRRKVLGALGQILPFPILRPSKAGKGGDTLLLQAEKIARFAGKGLPVAQVFYGDRDFLIAGDGGETLERPIKSAEARTKGGFSETQLHRALLEMSRVLSEVHAAGLVHGRPKIRDFAWRDGRVTILDLEERPEEVMPLAAAQARDVFLWITDLSTWPFSREIAPAAAAILHEDMNKATLIEMRKLLRLLRVAAGPARLIQRIIPDNREINGGLAAYAVLKGVFGIAASEHSNGSTHTGAAVR